MGPVLNVHIFAEPGHDPDFVPNAARRSEISVALSNSFGCGGTDGTLVFRRA